MKNEQQFYRGPVMEEQFAALVVMIWRLRLRRAIHKASGNQRAARWAQTRIESLARELAA